MTSTTNKTAARPAFRKGTLAAVIGSLAAVAVLTQTPKEESGRTVKVTLSGTGEAKVRHVSGKQYLTAYLDIARLPTACDGITRGVRARQRFTEAQCAALLEKELVEHAEGVMACTPSLRRDSRDWQRAAAVMMAYNIGVAAWCGSTARKRFDAGDFRAGCDAFLLWDKAKVNGRLQQVRGLANRRARERAMCLRGL